MNSSPFPALRAGPPGLPAGDSPRPACPAFLTLPAYAEASGEVLCPWIPGPLDVRPDPGKNTQIAISSFKLLEPSQTTTQIQVSA